MQAPLPSDPFLALGGKVAGSLGGVISGTWDKLYWQQTPHGLAEDLNISGPVVPPPSLAFFS